MTERANISDDSQWQQFIDKHHHHPRVYERKERVNDIFVRDTIRRLRKFMHLFKKS